MSKNDRDKWNGGVVGQSDKDTEDVRKIESEKKERKQDKAQDDAEKKQRS